MTCFFVIPMTWVDDPATEVLSPAQKMQLRQGKLVTIADLTIVAKDLLPTPVEPMRPRASHLADLRRRLRHGWRAC